MSWKLTRMVSPLDGAGRQHAPFEQPLVRAERAHDLCVAAAAGRAAARSLRAARSSPRDRLRFLQVAHETGRRRIAGGTAGRPEFARGEPRVTEQPQRLVVDDGVAVEVFVAGVVLVAEHPAAECRDRSAGRRSASHQKSRSSITSFPARVWRADPSAPVARRCGPAAPRLIPGHAARRRREDCWSPPRRSTHSGHLRSARSRTAHAHRRRLPENRPASRMWHTDSCRDTISSTSGPFSWPSHVL